MTLGLTNIAFATLSLILLGTTASVQAQCPTFWIQIGDLCYHKNDELMTYSEAAEYCSTLSTAGGAGTIATFPRCDDFASFTGYLTLTAPTEGNYWVGATSDFQGNWYWDTYEPLQLGVPFWAYTEGNDDGQDCASMDRRFWFQLMDDDCGTMKGVACMAPAAASATRPEETTQTKTAVEDPDINCPHDTTLVGENCYYFSHHDHEKRTWFEADEDCQRGKFRDSEDWSGELFSPASCEEFTNIAHHLQLEDTTHPTIYWVGAIDVSGYNEWTWVNGESLSAGVPYWAYGQPNGSGEGLANDHCAVMGGEKGYYLSDHTCTKEYRYICKVHLW